MVSKHEHEAYQTPYRRKPHVDREMYARMYSDSIRTPDDFWLTQARTYVTWYKEPTVAQSVPKEPGHIEWYKDGTLNVSYNCIDRHIEHGLGDKVAIIWEANDGESKKITYNNLLREVNQLANVLKERGVQKGDRVCIYMPMIPEAVFAMLACARIGAVHTVVFGGFSAASLEARINDAQCVALVTAERGRRGDKNIPLFKQVTQAVSHCKSIQTVLVVRDTDNLVLDAPLFLDYRAAVQAAHTVCEPEIMQAEDPLFILYTSGSTGKPKGVLHTTGGYLVYASMTHALVFDYHDDDVYWCVADVGWITGHSYVVYGPLANAATTIIFEGVPTHPNASRYWQIIDKHKVNIFYTTPTALRTLMAQGDTYVKNTSRKSLVVLGTVGEPINPEAWRWYFSVVGEGRCPVVDTWWQTETGGIAITPLPGVTELQPGAATQPFFGIQPIILDNDGNELQGVAKGDLVLRGSWPGQMRDLYNDHQRFLDVYFRTFPGFYLTGDGVQRDAGGSLWITGRIDDVMNISGHLIGTAEVESALVLHESVAEAAVVAVAHGIKGSAMCAYVVLRKGATYSESRRKDLVQIVAEQVGSFAKPQQLYVVDGLPKTRSGKIMRRILRKIAEGETDDLGDVTTLAEPEVVEAIVQSSRN